MHIDILQDRGDECPKDWDPYRCWPHTRLVICCPVDPCDLGACPMFAPTEISSLDDTEATTASESETIATSSEETTTTTTTTTTPPPPTGVLRGAKPSSTDAVFMTIIETRESTIMVGTMTDSGTTRTIPNHSKVTITKKTTIVTDKSPIRTPSPSTSTALDVSVPSTLLTSTFDPLPSETGSPEAGSGNGSPLPTSAIVGMAIGGLAALGILIVLIMAAVKRRKEGLHRSHSSATLNGGTELISHGEKLPQSMSAHTTGTQGSGDPFAPFGGRVDKPGDRFAPPINMYEMDATTTAPVELPAISVGSQPRPRTEVAPVPEAGPSDPRANLNASLSDRRQNTYVNHWDQYRNLGQGEQRS